eukprot:3934570-Rhodomonas_salina.2
MRRLRLSRESSCPVSARGSACPPGLDPLLSGGSRLFLFLRVSLRVRGCVRDSLSNHPRALSSAPQASPRSLPSRSEAPRLTTLPLRHARRRTNDGYDASYWQSDSNKGCCPIFLGAATRERNPHPTLLSSARDPTAWEMSTPLVLEWEACAEGKPYKADSSEGQVLLNQLETARQRARPEVTDSTYLR